MATVYYVAWVLHRDVVTATVRDKPIVVMAAGVDLLAGPFSSAAEAVLALPEACRAYRRQAALAGLGAHLVNPPCAVRVIGVTLAQVARYNRRHRGEAGFRRLVFPPWTLGDEVAAGRRELARG